MDVEIAGRGGGEEDEGEEERLFSNGCCFVAIPDVRCLIPLHLDKDDGLFFFVYYLMQPPDVRRPHRDHAYCTTVCQRVCHVQDSSRVSSISLRIWAEPEAATQREQGHGGDLQRVSIVQDSQLIMPIIQQRSSACVMYRKPLVCTP